MFARAASVSAAVRQHATQATTKVSGELERRGLSAPAARGLSLLLLAVALFLTPMGCTAVALALAWASLAVSMCVACMAACTALCAGLLVAAFAGLVALAGAAFVVTLLITVVVGLAAAHFLASCVIALTAARLFARLGSDFFGRMDSFISRIISDRLSVADAGASAGSAASAKHPVASRKHVAIDTPGDTVVEPVNRKLDSTEASANNDL